jgi:cell division protein FtsL
MFGPKKVKLTKNKEFFRKLPRVLAERFFLTFLILIFIALILGGLVFYKYSILVEQKKVEISEKQISFKEKEFQEILKIWEDNQKRLEEAGLKTHPDLFRTSTSTPQPQL